MKIEVWSDFSCPFCYIGKRKLEKALNSFEHKDSVEVIYKSFQLNPNAPETSDLVGYKAFASVKGTTEQQAKEMMDSVALSAKKYDLEYHMDKIQMTSTFKAHRLSKWARTKGLEKEVVEAFMSAYFKDGASLSNNELLLSIVEKVGLDKNEASNVLNQNDFFDDVKKDIDEAQALGIQGVPFFVFDRKYAISGAQPDDHFSGVLKKVFEENSVFKQVSTDDDNTCGPDGCDI